MEELGAGLVLQKVLNDALDQECSDVHIFSVGDELVVQLRFDGRLVQVQKVPGQGPTVLRRIKALARMDIAETRIPQDGAFHWVSESHESAIRVASLPTIDGEAMVLRLLPKRRRQLDLCALGLSPTQAQTVTEWLRSEVGLVLVAGPTSSGKTTTLYAMMEQLIRMGRRVISIEDPVEQLVEDCHQMQVRERIGVTFDVGLRAALRQDPDVIMVGEIRDVETARTALRASLTGHLVLSTTHATDMVGAVARLVDLGLDRSLVSEVLRGVITQRLEPAGSRVASALTGKPSLVSTERIGVFTLHSMTPDLAVLLASEASWPSIRQQLARVPKVGHYGVS